MYSYYEIRFIAIQTVVVEILKSVPKWWTAHWSDTWVLPFVGSRVVKERTNVEQAIFVPDIGTIYSQ